MEKSLCIRLLELLPGKHADHISCRLHLVSLGSHPEFEALSYCWGDDTEKLSIQVDEKVLNVTQNLRSALRHLRSPSQVRWLWIDGICINQKNLDEQSQQVSIMREIYRSATRTIIWLGILGEDAKIGFSTCHALERRRLAGIEMEVSNDTKILAQTGELPVDQSVTNKDLPEKCRTAVGCLVELPWFERIWVVQEIGVARDAVVVCGLEQISWDVFQRGINYGLAQKVLDTNAFGVVFRDNYENFRAVANIQDQDTSGPPSDQLLDLLIQFRVRKAENPVDKVFSLLGLVGDVDQLGLIPNYNLSPSEVFRLTTISLLSHSQNLDVLGSSTGKQFENPEDTLPSWVVDWSDSNRIPFPFRMVSRRQRSNFKATNGSVASIEFSEDKSVLNLSGYIIDSISEVENLQTDLVEEGWFDYVHADEEDEGDASLQGDESLQGAATEMLDALRLPFSELFRMVDYFGVFLGWEKLAKVTERDGPSTTPTREEHRAIYWQTLCAGNLPNGYFETEKQFAEWYKSLGPFRRLSYLRLNVFPSVFKPLAFAGYLRTTWGSYSAFGDVMQHTTYRRLARTTNGYLCLVPAGGKKGDSIALCKGGNTPLILRSDDRYWTLVGECYVHGIMNGEKFDEEACYKLSLR